jgi:hypothetical protein
MMEVRRGVDPVRFELVSEGRPVGEIRRTESDLLVVRFSGFLTSALAERAGWLARSARQSDEFARRANPGGTTLLSRTDDLARIEPVPEGNAWSVELALIDSATSDVFVLGRARRMWEAIRRSGLPRQMLQWSPRPVADASPTAAAVALPAMGGA